MIKWTLVVLLALAAIFAQAIAIGWLLPITHVATRQAEVPAAPDRVWATITDIDAFPAWRPDVTRVERIAGQRLSWEEHGRNGRLTFVVERSDPPRTLVTRIADRDLPFGGTWTYEIAPAPRGSAVTITEHGEIYNPLFRFMSRFVFGYDSTMQAYLTALAATGERGTGN